MRPKTPEKAPKFMKLASEQKEHKPAAVPIATPPPQQSDIKHDYKMMPVLEDMNIKIQSNNISPKSSQSKTPNKQKF